MRNQNLHLRSFKETDTTKEILRQLKYDSQQMESLLLSIDKTEIKKQKFIGKPYEKTCVDAIKIWNKEFSECLITFQLYSKKLNSILKLH